MKEKGGRTAPSVLIEINREYQSIFNKLNSCCGMWIKVEGLRTRTEITQCHRCQLFGHCQSQPET